MRYWIKATLGLVLAVGGIVAFEYSLYHLMGIGTCSSGGPYVSARPCPAGTGSYAALLPAGIIGGLIGLIIFVARGRRPGGGEQRIGGATVGLFGWCALFIGTGTVALVSALSGDSGDAKGVGIFLGALFIPMGLIPALIAIAGRRALRRPGLVRPVFTPPAAAPRPAAPARPPQPVATDGDPLDRLRQLGELRDSGVLSPAEFDAAKARILAQL